MLVDIVLCKSSEVVKYLAYADNLCIIAGLNLDVNSLIARVEEFTVWAGLSFKAPKCAVLS